MSVAMAMAGMYQEARIDQGVDKKDKKGGQETSRGCLERAGVRRAHPSLGQTNGEPGRTCNRGS